MHLPLRRIAGAAFLFLAALAVFWPGLSGSFIFDDYPNLVGDPDWQVTALTSEQLARALGSGASSVTGRPLAILSFALNHRFTGLDPFWLKLTGVLMHALNALLVWCLLTLLFRHLPAGRTPRPPRWAAWGMALAWLVHPLQVSTVLYVVQRMEIGAATGVLLALLAYMHARALQIARRPGWPWIIVAACATAFGIGFKETAALAPGYAFLIELCIFRFASGGANRARGWIVAYAMMGAVAVAAFAHVAAPMASADAAESVRSFTGGQRLLTQGPVLAMYLGQILLPLPASLLFYYDNFPLSTGLFSPSTTACAFLLLVLMAAGAAASVRRWPLTALGIGWFFVGHALTSNVIALELAFEHRNYLPMLGILLALVQPMCWLGKRLHADAAAVLAAVPVLALASVCVVQAATWGDPLKLAWTHENINRTSQRASYALAERLFASAGDDTSSPLWSMARGEMEVAASLPGGSSLPLQALIVMDGRSARPIAAATWQAFGDVLTLRPLGAESTGALYAVSQCRIVGPCDFAPSDLLQVFLRVLARNPANPDAYTLYADFAWNVLDDAALAIELQRESVALSRQSPPARLALAKFLLGAGQAAEGHALLDALDASRAVSPVDVQAARAIAPRAEPAPERSP